MLLDKWAIEPGADTVNYMEKCVKDSTVNFVLILLDEEYAKKADDRKGGVGIETQIISDKVYRDVSQNQIQIKLKSNRNQNKINHLMNKDKDKDMNKNIEDIILKE